MTPFLIASLIQGVTILFDEFVFHRRRGLPRWERIGHPIDTLSVIACLLFLTFMDRTPTTEKIYFAMAVGSSLLVTKDEWIHRKLCSAEEMWLHAILFMIHPLVLFAAMAEWDQSRPLFVAMAGGIVLFLMYQVIYWNFVEVRARKAKAQAHYAQVRQDELYEYFGE